MPSGDLAVGAAEGTVTTIKSPRRKRLPRRSLEETRRLMLAAGTATVAASTRDSSDAAIAAALAHVKVARVVDEATRMVREQTGDPNAPAVTIGSIYQLWPTQADFQAELLLHIAKAQAAMGRPGLEECKEKFGKARDRGVSATDLLRRILTDNFGSMHNAPIYRVVLTFYGSANNPQVREALALLHGSIFDGFGIAAEALLDTYELRMRQPYEIQHLVMSITALMDGSYRQAIADPDALDDPHDDPKWTLPSRTASMLFEQLTEPRS